jgi:hypothetical protein
MFKFSLSVIIIIASLVLCQQIILISIKNQKNKNDYAEINHIKYGLFSVDKWKLEIGLILVDEINKINLSKMDQHELKKHIEVQLNTLIDKIDANIRAGNKGSAEGWVKQKFMNIFVNLHDIKKGIPGYADAVLKEMTRPKSKEQIKGLLKENLQQYLNKTFDKQDNSRLNIILKRMGTNDAEGAQALLRNEITANSQLISQYAFSLIAICIFLFLLSIYPKHTLMPYEYLFMTAGLLILLIAGITTPMIDMEAKISEMSFVLLDHPVIFKNQVLYFQTKSILDVFWIMITDKAIQMKMVGILVVTFSIVFPITKILCSAGYFYNLKNFRKNKIIHFFAFDSGKWSMADVLVVAIFMAYIGFNGIITSQFGQLSSSGQGIVVLTTNGTSLQPGYYLFFSYIMLALILSGYLKHCSPKVTPAE